MRNLSSQFQQIGTFLVSVDFCRLLITFANSLNQDQDRCNFCPDLDLVSTCRLLITFANSLDPDQDRQNVSPDLDPNGLTF